MIPVRCLGPRVQVGVERGWECGVGARKYWDRIRGSKQGGLPEQLSHGPYLGTGPAGGPCEWRSINGSVTLPLARGSLKALALEHALCLTGDGLAHLQAEDPQQLLCLIPHVQVFARVAPKQKVGKRGGGIGQGPGGCTALTWPISCPCRSLSSPA